METRNYLAIDIGTTNWKAAVFDVTGRRLATAHTPAITHTDQNGNSFYRPQEIWQAVGSLCRQVQQGLAPVRAVSVASVAEAVVAIGRDGRPLGDIITWFDRRAIAQAEWLEHTLGTKTLYSITGLDVNPIFSLPKILWVRENQPQVYEKAWKWLQIADYILFCLCGQTATDHTLASRTLAFDLRRNVWSQRILAAVGVPEDTMPAVVESGTVLGHVSRVASEHTGLPATAKVVMGGNDHPCGSVAVNVLDRRNILDSSGTAESFILVSPRQAPPPLRFQGQRTCRYLQKDRYALWGGIIASGKSFDWACCTLAPGIRAGDAPALRQMLEQAERERGMQAGAFFYPHLRGAGAPHWEPRSHGAFLGLRDLHTPAMLLKSVMEGLSMQARMIVEMEERLAGFRVERLCVIGGSSRNLQWQRIKANVLQRQVELCGEPEAVAQGAAMLAAIGDGACASLEEASAMLARGNTVIEPDPAMAGMYDPLYELYAEGYEALVEFNRKLFDLQRG